MPTRELTLTPSSREAPEGWSVEGLVRELERAADAWSVTRGDCRIAVRVAPAQSFWAATEDGVNLVAFRTESWCHNGRCGHLRTFPRRAVAMTTTYPEGARGSAVVEADVELNGVDFRFESSDRLGTKPSGERGFDQSLKKVLVHEIGHALGLEDHCGTGGHRSTNARHPPCAVLTGISTSPPSIGPTPVRASRSHLASPNLPTRRPVRPRVRRAPNSIRQGTLGAVTHGLGPRHSTESSRDRTIPRCIP